MDDSERAPRSMAMASAYLALIVCFAVANFTNATIVAVAHRWGVSLDASAVRVAPRLSTSDAGHYWLGSIRDTAFFLGLAALAWLMRDAARPVATMLVQRRVWINVLIGLAAASIFLLQIWPISMGQVYAANSADPFMQEAGSYNRRILLPALAYQLHFGGAAYPFFYWGIVLVTLVLTDGFLERQGLRLSRIERTSLYTVGVFGTALGLPGFGEILVFAFALIAMLDFDRVGRTTLAQPILFGLSLLTHESAALMSFGVLALCRFDRRFVIHYAALTLLYGLLWLAPFGFSPRAAAGTQGGDGLAGVGWALRHLPLVALSVAATYKLTLLALVAAAWMFARTGAYRDAGLILVAGAGSAALPLLATDYGRVVAFGSFALLIALPVVLPRLSGRQRMVAALVNLAIPTVLVTAHHITAYHGLYGLVMTGLFGMRG